MLTFKKATHDDVQIIKKLDDLAFGPHQGASLSEITQVVDHGVTFLCFEKGELVAHSQIVTEWFEGCEIFPSDYIYCFGMAIHPRMQGQGIGKKLVQMERGFAIGSGRKGVYLTSRIENYPSLKLRIGEGCFIVGYKEYLYSNDILGSRVLLVEEYDRAENNFSPESHTRVILDFNAEPSESVHKKIQALLASGCLGFSVGRQGISFAKLMT